MQPATVLLIRSASLGWIGLHATLEILPEVHIVDDVQECVSAFRVAVRKHPDMIFVASDVQDVAPVGIIHDLRAARPSSHIIMIGKVLHPEEHRQLIRLGLTGFLQWECVTAGRLEHLIELVRDGELRFASEAVIQVLYAPEHQNHPCGATYPNLTPKEEAVLRGLARGCTRQQIATSEGVCLRTIDDRIATLKDKFEAPTTFMLGVKAERVGLVPLS